MKQMLTLLLCLGAAASGIAQTSSERSRDIILGRPSSPSSTPTDNRSKDVILGRDNGRVYDQQGNRTSYPNGSSESSVDAINREYDAKVQSIRNNPYLTTAEKERAIRQLNNDRTRRIKAINNSGRRYQDRDRDYDNDYKKNKKVKGNNGNHYGWDRGKGNQRKNKSGKRD